MLGRRTPGRHLRSRGPDRRDVLVALGTFLLGVLAGAGGVAALDAGAVPVADAAVLDAETLATARPADDASGAAVPEPTTRPVTLAFVGDVHVEGVLGHRLDQRTERFVGPFSEVLAQADLVVANLEAALTTDRGTAADKKYVFRAPPAVLDALRAGGIDVVSAANNHAIDFGSGGLAETLDIVRRRDDGMVIGIGEDEDAAYAPHLQQVGGRTVAVIAATQVLDGDLVAAWTAGEDHPGVASAKRVERLVEEVAAARSAADVVAVYLHWGIETQECPSTAQQELARALVDAGADVVVGTHAHRVQGGGRMLREARSGHGGPAAVHYGLGNFLFGAPSAASARTGVFVVEVGEAGVTDHRWVPGRIRGSVPEPLAGAQAEAEVRAWEAQRGCTGLEP